MILPPVKYCSTSPVVNAMMKLICPFAIDNLHHTVTNVHAIRQATADCATNSQTEVDIGFAY